ncbi:MAG: MCE family protein [Actinomycetota bacterium]|nr:MCE family protein [Actinomycetota bacterium]
MISRQTKLQLLVFGLISLLGLTYTGVKYAGLNFISDRGYLVSADFSDSGGIFTGAEVTNRGVPTGSVESLQLQPTGVRVVMRLKPGSAIPNDVKAVIGNRSAIGEQFVDLQPQRDGGPFLRRGDVIDQQHTAIPISPTTLLVNLDRLVKSVDLSQLGILLEELGTSFQGAGDSLQRLVDRGDALTRSATDALPQTTALIRDGQKVLDTQRAVAGQFQSFNRDLAALSTTLRSSDPDFRKLFADGTTSALATKDLLDSNRTALPVLLGNLVTVAQVQAVRLPALRQILVTYPNVVAGGFTVVPGDGTTHFGLVLNNNPPPCQAGYQTTVKRPPADTTLKTPNLAAYCAEKRGSPTDVRGAQNAPRPPGVAPFPNDGSNPNGTGAGSPAGLSGGSAGLSGGSAGLSGGSAGAGRSAAATTPADSVVLGDYNPVTGQVITADGTRLTLGSTAGAQRLYGDESWHLLLLGPLTS